MKPSEPAPRLAWVPLGISLLWLAALLALSLFQDRSLLFPSSWTYILRTLGISLKSLPGFLFRINPGALWIIPLGLSGFGLGRAILFRLFKDDAPAGICLGLGLGLLSLLALALASPGLATPASVRGLLAVLAAYGLLELALVWQKRSSRLRSVSAAEWLIAAVVAGAGLIVAFSLLQPTFFYDALTFHLAMPRSYLLTGDTLPRPFITYSYFPQNLEMLYLLGLAAGGVAAAQLVNALVWLALILLGRDLGEALAGKAAGAFSALALALVPTLAQNAMLMSNDNGTALFGLLGLWCLVRIMEENSGRAWLLWGAALGLAAGAKYTAYLFVILPQALVLLILQPRSWRRLFVAGLAGVVVALPWWLRNLLAVGNPVFPALAGWLGGGLNALAEQKMRGDAHAVALSWRLLSDLWRLPRQLFGWEPAALDSTFGSASLIGPMVLAGLPFLLLQRPLPRGQRAVLSYAVLAFAIWLGTFRMVRFVLPGLAAAAALSGLGWSLLLKRLAFQPLARGAVKGLLAAFAVSALALSLNYALGLTQGFFTVRLQGGGADYLMRRSQDRTIELGSFPIMPELNQKLPADARVLLVGETAFFYLQRPCLAPSFLDPNPLVHLIQQGLPFPAVAGRLREAGLTHVLYRPDELDRLERDYQTNHLSPGDRARLEEFFQSEACRPFAFQEQPRVLVCELAPE